MKEEAKMASKNMNYESSPLEDNLIKGLEESALGEVIKKKEDDLGSASIYHDTNRSPAKKAQNPTLIIGLGGTGIRAIDSLKKLMIDNSGGKKIRSGVGFLGFDCDQNEVMQCRNLQANVEVFATTLSNPKKFHSYF